MSDSFKIRYCPFVEETSSSFRKKNTLISNAQNAING